VTVRVRVSGDAARSAAPPPVSITDGSTDYVVVHACCTGSGFRRPMTLTMATSPTDARRLAWTCLLDRLHFLVVTPAAAVLLVVATILVIRERLNGPRSWGPLLVLAVAIVILASHVVRRVINVVSRPTIDRNGDVWVEGVHARAAELWKAANEPGVIEIFSATDGGADGV